MAYSPKRAMAELRHSSSIGARASSSPMKRDEDSSPLIPADGLSSSDDDNARGRHSHKDRDRSFCSHFHSLCPFLADDSRVSYHPSRISLFFLLFLLLLASISIFSLFKHIVQSSSLFPDSQQFAKNITFLFLFLFFSNLRWIME